VPGLIHDAALRSASNGGAGGVASPQGMTGVFRRIKASAKGPFLNDASDIGGRKTHRAQVPRAG
jgi:hypothetical protein